MRATGRPSASPLSSPAVAIGSLRSFLRRHSVGRLVALGIGLAVVIVSAQRGETARAAAEARWAATSTVWLTTGPVEAGALLEPGDVVVEVAPPGLTPSGAVVDDPTGQRVRVPLGAGEIVVAERLSDSTSTFAARTPDGWGTVSLGRGDALFGIGDLVDLHHVVDGHLLADGAVIVAVTDDGLGIAVPPDDIGDVVRALGQAGVVPVLTG